MSEEAKASVEVCNKLGLHIRPSRYLASLAKSYDATVTVRNNDREALADSQLDLLMLLASKGAQLEISATGPQAEEAVHAIVGLIKDRFGEKD
ncbi:HPr family phosphocarrier protein [Hyphococcus flavus]|uniref:HPr family phosphocarrier protein n=1 Tax=Hyphococcus flavus TaxID=1866326 RepID=A0AAE9ZE36_9PROT|nr:HPr family phosphocarrier protein [Hyphococcus flavus]WDI31985.1 HPr family phosphocarrier protein [Hyphococcus flavus]